MTSRVRGLFASRIGRLIFIWNLIGFAILALGFLLLTELRAQLVRAQLDALRSQGAVVAHVLVQVATTEGDPVPEIDARSARSVLSRLLPPQDRSVPGPDNTPRIRLVDRTGTVIADTNLIDPGITARDLPGLGTPPDKSLQDQITTALETWRLTPWRADFSAEEERASALGGEVVQGQRLDELGRQVISVSLPIRRVEAILGAVTIEVGGVERYLATERLALLPFIAGAALVTLFSSALLALFIAQPLNVLAQNADRLRLTGGSRLDTAGIDRRPDEIGDLAQALDRMTSALADRIAMTESFAADVAHELKNPLTSIRSATETVLRVQDPDARAKLLTVIAADVGRLDRLITDISRATRIEAETARGANERVDLGRFLADLTDVYAQLRREGQAAVTFRGPVPEGAETLGQAGPLGQVFRNLIDNALSFTPKEGVVTVSVALERRRDGPWVRAMVEDQGPGIPAEALARIFERFYTQRPAGAAFGGNSGLGLSIARAIVDQHKGKIWAENIGDADQPLGARLIVELPAAPQGWDG